MKLTSGANRPEPRIVSTGSEELTDAVARLAQLPDEIFWYEGFSRSVFSRGWDRSKMHELGSKADECGAEYASQLREQLKGRSIEQLCREKGIAIEEFSMPLSPSIEIFALFEPPCKISIRTDLLSNCDDYIHSSGLTAVLGEFCFKDVILAHEFFHYIENRDNDVIFTRCYKEPYGFFKRQRDIPPLGEIAAMSFARTLLELQWSPFVLDCVMMGMNDTVSAMNIAQRLLALSEEIS